MNFLDDKILLGSDLAVNLYEEYAKELPIIDYHCHINQYQILEDKKFSNLTQLWLSGDHYKWRLMRNCAVDEEYITGGKTDREKFQAFAKCLPLCIGNPIYIWCHLELKKYFDLTVEINGETADEIYDLTEKMLKSDSFSARNIISRSNVKVICTTDDPTHDLLAHKALKAENLGFKVLPTLRPDKALNIEIDGFNEYIGELSSVSGVDITDINSLKSALSIRLNYFIENGCKISDHALSGFTYADCSESDADRILRDRLNGKNAPSHIDAEKYRTYILLFLAKEYAKNDIVMQLHFNCLRNNNTAMFKRLGADTGFDCINSSSEPQKLAKFLDSLSADDNLPKTVIYSLDPSDDRLINTVINCFQKDVRGKIQHGSAWWFNDTEHGMREHLKTLAEYSVFGNFIGMLTDSRSFTSYVRHDYFRRILCDFIAEQVNTGKYPKSEKYLRKLIEDICYNNINNYMF